MLKKIAVACMLAYATPTMAASIEVKLVAHIVGKMECGVEYPSNFDALLYAYQSTNDMTDDEVTAYLANRAANTAKSMREDGTITRFCQLSRELEGHL